MNKKEDKGGNVLEADKASPNQECLDWHCYEEGENAFTTLEEILSDAFQINEQFKLLLEFSGMKEPSKQTCIITESSRKNSTFSINPHLLFLPNSRTCAFKISTAGWNRSLTKNAVIRQPRQPNPRGESKRSERNKLKLEIDDNERRLITLKKEKKKILVALNEFKKYTVSCLNAQDILKNIIETNENDEMEAI